MNLKINLKTILTLSVIVLGLNNCKKDEPSKAMTTIHGRFVEYGSKVGIKGLPVSLIEYKGLGFQYEQLTDIIYTDSAGYFTINHELEREGVYEIYSYDLSFTYTDPGDGHHPFNFTLGKPVNLVFNKYVPAWVNVRVINKTRPVYLYYSLGFLFGKDESIFESLKCYDTTFNFKLTGNEYFDLHLNIYKNQNEKIIEKLIPINVLNWDTKDTTITF